MADTPIGFPAQRTPAILRSLLTDLRATGDVRREEAVTGRLADPVAALGGRISEALAIERDLASLSAYRQTITLAETRAQTAQAVFDQLRVLTDELTNQSQLALENRGQNALEIASKIGGDALDGAIASLNARVGGRSVFAGNGGDAPALASAAAIRAEVVTLLEAAPNAAAAEVDVRLAFDQAGGTFETLLYLGGTGDAPEAEIAPGERVRYQSRADEQPIRDILRNIAVISAAYDPDVALSVDDRRTLMEGAVNGLRNTVDPLNRISAEIGSAEARIEAVKARSIAEETALTVAFNDRTGADTLVAASELQAVETQLEVLFLTTARFSGLSLVNFLR